MARPLPLSSLPLFGAAFALASTAAAQSGGSATIAPLAQGAVLHDPSPLFEWPNGYWDLGEGFSLIVDAPDTGGAISTSDPNGMVLSDLVVLKPFGQDSRDPNVYTMTATIRPSSAKPGIVTEASFEIAIPAAGFTDQGKRSHVVLLIGVRPTASAERPQDRVYAPHDYPGDPTKNGTWEWPFPGFAPVTEFASVPSMNAPFYVAGGNIVPRTSFQPLVHDVQRVRELRRAMMMLINQEFTAHSYPTPSYSTCIVGSSFGGLVAQTAIGLWPNEFHSGVSFAFNANLHGTPNDQSSLDFLVNSLGLSNSGANYTLRAAADWTIFDRVEDVDYTALSTINRIAASGLLRPMIMLAGDEDPVTHGQDWMHPLGASSGHAEPYWQRVTFTDGSYSWNVDGFIVGKRCHGGDIASLGEPVFFPGDNTPYHDDLQPVRLMVYESYNQRMRILQPLTPPQRKLGKAPNIMTLDPHDKVLTRKGVRTAPTYSQPLLVEAGPAQGWHSYGRGTWLGAGESLKVKKLPGESLASIFVGSNDGLVTRYQLDTNAQSGFQPLAQKAASVSLGYGVYALDVGSLGSGYGNGSYKVVAAAYRRVVILDAATLVVEQSYDLPDWEQSEPMHLQIAELVGSTSTHEIVFRTLHGRIVVMELVSGQLHIYGQHSDAGIIDLLVGPRVGPRVNTAFSNGIWLLSARGHLVGLEMDSNATDPKAMGMLSVASQLQYGGIADLEVAGSNLALLAVAGPSEDKAIRIFNPANLDRVTQFARVDQPTIMTPYGDILQYAVPPLTANPSCLAITAQGKYVTLYSGYLAVWDYGNDVALGLKNLEAYPPTRNACAMEVGDVDGDGVDDVVVSTVAGRVVWLKISELTTLGQDLGLTRSVTMGSGQLYDDRMNAAIACTWGLTVKQGSPSRLHAIDVSGGWWVIDPISGQPTITPPRTSFVLDTGIVGVRGLAYGPGSSSFTVNAQGGSNDTFWRVDPLPPSFPTTTRSITTSPYMPQPAGTWAYPVTLLSALSWDDFWIFAKGGAAVADPGISNPSSAWRVAWWGIGSFPNLVQQMVYSASTTPAPVSLWSSTGSGGVNGPPSATAIGAPWPASGVSLRTSLRNAEVDDLQTLAIGKVIPGETVMHTVVTGMGGRVIVIDGTTGHIRAQSEDLGYGGMALALADLDGDTYDEIIVAPAIAPIDAEPAPNGKQCGWMRSYVHVLKYVATPTPHLARVSSAPIGDPYATHDLHGYGACGIAVHDLNETGQPHPTPEIIVTTLNGELVVFAQQSGIINPTPLFATVVEGQLGAFNSIVVGDFDTQFFGNKPEVYIASSTGIRKFYAQ